MTLSNPRTLTRTVPSLARTQGDMGFLHVFQELPRAFRETYQGPGHEVRLVLCNWVTHDLRTLGPHAAVSWVLFGWYFRLKWWYFDAV